MRDMEQVTGADPVLVVGATGDLGGRVARDLLARGRHVRALVREGTDAGRLTASGIDVVRGDLLDPASLDRALDGVAAAVTTANGYSGRRKGDTLQSVDDRGNRNLVDAAARAGTGRFVFTSVLTADQAPDVPHFWQKKRIEDHLEDRGVPFVSVRPGALFGGAQDFWARDLRKGRLTAIGDPRVAISSIHVDDAARLLADAVDAPGAVGRRIDVAMEHPMSYADLAEAFSTALGRDVRLRSIPWPLVDAAMRVGGVVNPRVRDFRAMFEHFQSGAYVADTALQRELLGDPPAVEASLERYLRGAGLLPDSASAPASRPAAGRVLEAHVAEASR